MAHKEVAALVSQTVLAGDNSFDLVCGQQNETSKTVINDYYINWYDVPYVALSNPWYPKNSVENASLNNKLYLLESNFMVSYIDQTWMLIFNSELADSHGIKGLYDYVYDGKWTLDRLNELTKDIYIDKDGDGARGTADTYGFAALTGDACMAGFFYSCEVPYAKFDSKGNVTLEIAGKKGLGIAERLNTLYYVNEGSLASAAGYKTRRPLFRGGNIMFSPMQVGDIYADFRDLEFNYGLLPYPKYDEAQAEYFTTTDAGCNIMSVPVTAAGQLELIGALVEALSFSSCVDFMPTYVSAALEIKGTRDEESTDMLQYILNNRANDFSYLYNGAGGWLTHMNKYVKSGNYASYAAENQGPVLEYYKSLAAYFLK